MLKRGAVAHTQHSKARTDSGGTAGDDPRIGLGYVVRNGVARVAASKNNMEQEHTAIQPYLGTPYIKLEKRFHGVGIVSAGRESGRSGEKSERTGAYIDAYAVCLSFFRVRSTEYTR